MAGRGPFALVSTQRQVFLVDFGTGAHGLLDAGDREFYGITWRPGGHELVLTHTGVPIGAMKTREDYLGSEVGFVTVGERRLAASLSLPHQALWASDGRVVVANTGRNALAVLDPDRPELALEVRLSPVRWDRLGPDAHEGAHYNSVFEQDGRLYVMAHGNERGSAVVTLSYPELRVLGESPVVGCRAMHNLWVTDEDEHIACDSLRGTLVELRSARDLWRAGDTAFLRGLAATSEFVVVGEGRKAPREQRTASPTALWVLDRRTWKPLSHLTLGHHGGVCEVRLLDVPDLAHHGGVFGRLDALLAATPLAPPTPAAQLEASTRLASRAAWLEAEPLWAGWRTAQGDLQFRSGGALHAPIDGPAAIVRDAPADPQRVGLRYAFEAGGTGFLSVAALLGEGLDSRQASFMLSPVDAKEALLTRWDHDGTDWQVGPAGEVEPVPTAGLLEAELTDAELLLRLDGHIVGRAELGPAPGSPRLALRWAGATLTPA